MAKRIGAIITLSLIGILIITTIVMSLIPVSYAIVCNTPDRIEYKVNNSGFLSGISDDDRGYIENYLNNTSKESSLVALFKNNINGKAEIVSGSRQTISYSSSNNYIKFVYNTNQKLMDGKSVYKDSSNNEYEYKHLTFEIPYTQEEYIKVYVTGASDNDDTYRKYYKLTGVYQELYNYITDMYNENNI